MNKVPTSLLTQVMDNRGYSIARQQQHIALISDVLGDTRNDFRDFPNHQGMLIVDKICQKNMKDWLDKLTQGRLNIGICWKSGLIDAARSVHYSELSYWEKIFKIEGVNFINLQYKGYEEDIKNVNDKFGVTIHVPEIDLRDDFDSVAALMTNLDLVIAPATAVIELAGMVGTRSLLFTNSPEVDWRVKANGYDLWHSTIKHVRADRNTDNNNAQISIVNQIEKEIKNMF